MNRMFNPKKAGLLLIVSSVLLLCASFLVCVLAVPEIVKNIPLINEEWWLPGMIFLWVSALPVLFVFSILIWFGVNISYGHPVNGSYIKKFKLIGCLIFLDVMLYFIPFFLFLSPDYFNLSMFFVCLIIQLGGAGLSAVSFAASTVMQKAAEYKEEVDTMF